MKEFLKKILVYKKLINFIILSLLLFGACFNKWFALAISVYVGIATILFNFEENIEMVLFLLPFRVILPYHETHIILTILAIKYLFDLIRKKKKLNFITLVPIIIAIVYLALPIHETSIKKTILYAFILGIVYLLFEYRKELSFVNIVRFLCFGLILSCALSYLKPISPYLEQQITFLSYLKMVRLSGLDWHPTTLMYLCTCALCGLLICKLNKKMSIPEFFLLFIPIFVFGYLTISRNFVLSVGTAFVIFAVFYLIKYKSKAWKFLLVFILVNLTVIGCCFMPTKMYLVRFKLAPESFVQEYMEAHKDVKDSWIEENKKYPTTLEQGSEEWYESLLNGEFKYDPGREEIHKLYWDNYTSSTKIIFFGRGIKAPEIGMMYTHSAFLQLLWTHGICGTIILLCIIGAYLYCYGLKKIWKYWQTWLMLIPYFIILIQESILDEYLIYILLFSCFTLLDSLNEKPRKVKVLYYNTSLNMGGADMYMLNLIKNANRDKFDFDVIIKTKRNANSVMEKEFNSLNVPVKYLGNNILSQIITAIKTVIKVNYNVMHINATSGVIGLFSYIGKDFGGIENVIFHSHMGGNDDKKSIADIIGGVLAKDFSDNLVACSDLAAIFMYGKSFCKKHKVGILNNAVDINKFKYNKKIREDYRKQLKLGNKFVILNVGRFVPQKNQSKLIDVYKTVCELDKNCVLLMVGTGEMQEKIKNKVNENKLKNKVIFLNERTDVNNIMQASDVFVMTSLHEGLPIVAVEAQTSGLFLVLSNAITETTNISGNCTFVDLNADEKIWANEILKIKQFSRKDVSNIMINKRFDLQSANEDIENLYLRMLQK